MPKIKEVYEYNNGSWENGTPIGADASNVDVALSDSTSTRDLQSVLGNVSVSDSSIKTQLSGKVDTDSGDIKDTVVSVLDPSSVTDTSEDIDSTDVIVAAGEDQTTMWSKFNTFRKRVSNKFNNFLISSVEDVVTPSDTRTYSQAALNSYFADVIGYKTDADVASIGSVADQLSTLNSNFMVNYYHAQVPALGSVCYIDVWRIYNIVYFRFGVISWPSCGTGDRSMNPKMPEIYRPKMEWRVKAPINGDSTTSNYYTIQTSGIVSFYSYTTDLYTLICTSYIGKDIEES